MKYKEEIRRELDNKAKAIIIVGLVLAFVVMMIPLWQQGSAESLRLRAKGAEESLIELDKEERVLLSNISETNKHDLRDEVRIALAGI